MIFVLLCRLELVFIIDVDLDNLGIDKLVLIVFNNIKYI